MLTKEEIAAKFRAGEITTEQMLEMMQQVAQPLKPGRHHRFLITIPRVFPTERLCFERFTEKGALAS